MKNAANPKGRAALDSSKVGASIIIQFPRSEQCERRALRRKLAETWRSPADLALVYQHRQRMQPFLTEVVQL